MGCAGSLGWLKFPDTREDRTSLHFMPWSFGADFLSAALAGAPVHFLTKSSAAVPASFRVAAWVLQIEGISDGVALAPPA